MRVVLSLSFGQWGRKRIFSCHISWSWQCNRWSRKVTVEKADNSSHGNKHRFVNTQELQPLPVKLSVKSLLDWLLDCLIFSKVLLTKTSAVARSCSYYKLRKSSHWSSSYTRCLSVFRIPATSNEQFVFQLSWWKHASFPWATIFNNFAGFRWT